MEVLKKGRSQEGWTTETECTGSGNGDGGCGALLLVSIGDLYKTYNSCMGETDTYITFTCSECKVKTDVRNFPRSLWSQVRDREIPRLGL